MMVPDVARVSAPRITPSLNLMPTIVVPVEVCRGSLNPFCVNARFLILSATLTPQYAPLVVIKLESPFGVTDSCHFSSRKFVDVV
jgi:hypothetical protein